MICAQCGAEDRETAPVAALIVFAPGMPDGEPCRVLIPAGDYPLCGAEPNGSTCLSVFVFIAKAIHANEAASRAGEWTACGIFFKSPKRQPWMFERKDAPAMAMN